MLHPKTTTGLPVAVRILLFFLFFLSAAPAMATVYYVDIINGSDTYQGTSTANAWETLHHAIPLLASGDVLRVLPGTYIQTNGESDTALNITTDNIQILGSSTGGVILDGSVEGEWTAGLTVTNGRTGILIQNLEIKNFTQGIRVEQDASATIQGSNIHDNTYGIQVISSNLQVPRILKNIIENNSFGVSVTATIYSASPEILENIFKDNGTGIYLNADNYNISSKIINNLIYEYVSNAMTYGIQIQGYYGNSLSEIYHNTIDGGSGDGIYLYRSMTGSITPSIKFNNITNFGGYGINDNGMYPSSPTIEYNNVYNNAYGPTRNLTFSVPPNIQSSPQYNNPASGDYHLQSTSPGRNAIPAAAGDTVRYDLDGVDRELPAMGNKDIGCYEFLPDVPLNISVSPSSAGTITGVGNVNTTPANCTGSCIWNYIINETVQLNATAATGYQFSYWDEGGTQRTANPDTIIINGERTITGVFAPTSSYYTFSVSIDGNGSVSGSGIACPGDCSEAVSFGATVSITATPNAGYLFDHWEEGNGTPHTENPVSFSMDSDRTVTAFFVPASSDTYTLTISILPPGSGSVSDTGINCPGDCSETAASGSTFSLLASPNSGFVFNRWEEGETIKTDNPLTHSLEKSTRIAAVFVAEDNESNSPPGTPTAVSPSDETVFPDGTESITLQTSPFSDPDSDSHSYTHWLVKREDRSFYFNGDYPSSFDTIETSSPGLTRHTVSGLSSGMVYVWKAGYADSRGNISWSREYRFLAGDESQVPLPPIPPGKTARDYRMVSLPIWSTLNACRVLFGPSEGGYDIKFMRMGTWDAASGSYLECDDGISAKPGKAYWILARKGLDTEPSGIPVTTDLDVEVGLQQGWNMVACPNDREYTWLDVEVLEADSSGGTTLDPTPIRDLTDTTIINPRLFRWENGAYADDTEIMTPYEGYWVRAFRENLFLRFPVNAARTASSRLAAKNTKSGFPVRKASGVEETPPMPMGIDSETEKGGCFISIVTHKTGLH